MRTFEHKTGSGRKVVVIEVKGTMMRVIETKADGSVIRKEKELKDERLARSASDGLARELKARGFVERTSSATPRKAKPARKQAAVAETPALALGIDGVAPDLLEEDDGEPVEDAVLPRLATAPASAGEMSTGEAPKKKKKSGRKKKRKKKGNEDGLDKRVVAAVIGVGALVVVGAIFLMYDAFLKPPVLAGNWQGSRVEYETGGPMSYSQYGLILDEQNRAALTLQEQFTFLGTYMCKGNLLTLNLKDDEGNSSTQEYKITLGRATLDLYDPSSGKKVVQLVRFREKAEVGGGKTPPPAAPTNLASGAANADADQRLASVSFSPKDGAFRLRYPPGWKSETGSRPDNTYSWARFTKGSAKIQVYADVAGSLMSGSDIGGQYEEGSELAPVHNAHLQYKRTVSDEYSDYKESEPTLFKGSTLGEGRIATFTASGGGLFGSQLRGYRVTLLTGNRRITVLCESPGDEFKKHEPTFLAVSRSLSR